MKRSASILARTRDVVRKTDAGKLSMRVLADACGVSIPTLYNQFKDKDSLLSSALDELLRLRFQQVHLRDDRPYLGQMLALADGAADILLKNPQLSRWMFKVNPATPSQSSLLIAKELYRDLIERMVAKGEIQTALPPAFLTDRLFHRLRGVATEWVLGQVGDRGFKPLRQCEIALSLLAFSAPPLTEELTALLERQHQKIR